MRVPPSSGFREALGAPELEQEPKGGVPIGTPPVDDSKEVADGEVVGDPQADL